MSKLERLENELQTAIDTENYEKAARLRDEIQKLKG
jgi:protein-arginine kinase activator protein McsA